MFTRETRHGSFSILRAAATPALYVSFSLQTSHLFILKSSEIYYRRINQERRATCFMSLEVSRAAAAAAAREEQEEEEEQGEDINVNNNSLIT